MVCNFLGYSPTLVWNLWKSFGIEKARMISYWDSACPIQTNHPLVKTTVYIKSDQVLIALGNFDTVDQTIQLSIDWEALGFDTKQIKLVALTVANKPPLSIQMISFQ